MDQRTLGEVLDGSGDPRRGPGHIGRPLVRSGTSREKLGKVLDGSGETR